METKITFTFTLKVEDRTYTLGIVANTKEEAIDKLKSDFTDMISQLNSNA